MEVALLHIAQQHDLAFFTAGQGMRFDHARIIDDTRRQFARRLGRQVDLAAIGTDGAAILDQGIERALRHLQLDGTTQVQRDRAACTHQHAAGMGSDGAAVADLRGHQRDIATIGSTDGALIDDASASLAAEDMLVASQAGSVDIEGRSNKSTHIDLRGAAKQDAVRVDQVDLAVGIKSPEDLRTIAVENAVDGERAGRRLHEVDGFLAAHIEAGPVQRSLLARLLNRRCRAGLGDGRRAGHHLASRGSGTGGASQRQRRHGGRGRGQLAASALAAPARRLGNGNPGVQNMTPDESINVIQ